MPYDINDFINSLAKPSELIAQNQQHINDEMPYNQPSGGTHLSSDNMASSNMVGYDTNMDGKIDTVSIDFNYDGVPDVTISCPEGIDMNDFLNTQGNSYNNTALYGMDNSPQISSLNLTVEEKEWYKRTSNEIDDDKEATSDISFCGSATCIGGKTGCTGCAGLLIDEKIGCQTGACSGGVEC